MIIIHVVLCRKYDSTLDFEIDNKEFTNDLNHMKTSNCKYKINNFFDEEKPLNGDKDDLKEMRRIRLLDIQFLSILNEMAIYSIFLLLLYVISFFNLNNFSYIYNRLFLNTFVNRQSLNEIGLNDVIKFFDFKLF
jgi:hypothetical protein